MLGSVEVPIVGRYIPPRNLVFYQHKARETKCGILSFQLLVDVLQIQVTRITSCAGVRTIQCVSKVYCQD